MTEGNAHRLTVAPLGGLGNRMRVIRSAYAIALEDICDVRVAFPRLRECFCSFTDVFRPLESPAGNFRIATASLAEKPSRWRNLYIPSLLRPLIYDAYLYGFNASGFEDIRPLIAAHRRLYISGGYEFAGEDIPMGSIFRPSARVEDAVGKITERFGSYTVGFHVRTTDNYQSLHHSPLGLFIRKGQQELEEHPDAVFFLATDSRAVKRRFVTAFPSRVVTVGGSLDRSDRSGMILAAADMFALSRTDKVYGSWYSSFSEIAAELGSKKAEILKLD